MLFDAIEQTLKGTPMEHFINDLYEGTSINYVKCSVCNNESSRSENHLNISLTVRNQIDKVFLLL